MAKTPTLTDGVYHCPNCGKALKVRQRRSDNCDFLSCPGYPSCKFACDVPQDFNADKNDSSTSVASVEVTQPIERGVIIGTEQQKQIWEQVICKKQHLVVNALAGTGKTFTMVEAANLLIDFYLDAKKPIPSIFMVAFNKSIANELQKRVPSQVTAATMHSLGFKAVRGAFPRVRKASGFRTRDILSTLLVDKELKNMNLQSIVCKLVDLCKETLADYSDPQTIDAIADKYGIDFAEAEPRSSNDVSIDEEISDAEFSAMMDDLTSSESEEDSKENRLRKRIHELVGRVMEMCKDEKYIGSEISFTDMIWLPVVLGLSVSTCEFLMVDESQDLSPCQQALVFMFCPKGKVIVVGDRNQAIYGFRGADTKSMENMAALLRNSKRGVEEMPLTQTRRCPKFVVEVVKPIVPDFEAMDEAPDGGVFEVTEDKALLLVEANDFMICRVNAPLISYCYRLIREGRRAVILGRDIGARIESIITKIQPSDLMDLVNKLPEYRMKEEEKLAKRRATDTAYQELEDRVNTLTALMENCETVEDLKKRIKEFFVEFDDDGRPQNAVVLCSIHKSKGLEARQVFVIRPELLPFPKASDMQQEHNAAYVCATRTKENLFFIGAKPKIFGGKAVVIEGEKIVKPKAKRKSTKKAVVKNV